MQINIGDYFKHRNQNYIWRIIEKSGDRIYCINSDSDECSDSCLRISDNTKVNGTIILNSKLARKLYKLNKGE